MNLNHLISQCLHLRYLLLGLLTLSHYTASSTFAFAAAFFICRIRCLIDFCFLSFGRLSLFCFVFLNNRWLHIVNRIYTVCFRSVYAIVIVAWSIAFLAVVTASSTFAFAAAFLRLSRLVFGRFPLFSFRRFINRCFASSFLTTVGWILLIESKPFDFAVSTPALFVAVYRILSCCYCFIDFRFCCYLFFVCRIRRLIDFCFLSFRGFINRCFASSFLTTTG